MSPHVGMDVILNVEIHVLQLVKLVALEVVEIAVGLVAVKDVNINVQEHVRACVPWVAEEVAEEHVNMYVAIVQDYK